MLQSQRAKHVGLLASQLITDGEVKTVSAEMSGCRAGMVIVNLGVEETSSGNAPTVSLSEGTTTDATNQVTIVSNYSPDCETARQYVVHFQPTQKVLKLSITAGTGTGNDLKLSADLFKLRLEQEPASTTDLVASTHNTAKIR